MASRAKKKWRYRQLGINHDLKSKLISTGLVGAGTCINWDTTRQEKMSEVLLNFVEPFTAAADFQKIIDEMMARKQRYFAENRRFFLAHHWTMTTKGPHLSVISTTD